MVEFDTVGAGALGTAGVGVPFLTVLCPSERYYRERGRTHRSLTERARQILRVVDRWLPHREKGVVADSGFATLELLAALPGKLHVVTRLRLDAALYVPAPERRAGHPGRPRKKGQRLPTLAQVLADPATRWTPLTLPRWYSQGERTVEIVSGAAVWYHGGKPPVPIRWVLVRDPGALNLRRFSVPTHGRRRRPSSRGSSSVGR